LHRSSFLECSKKTASAHFVCTDEIVDNCYGYEEKKYIYIYIHTGNALAKAELGVKPPVSSLAGRLGIKLILWTTNTDLLDIHVHAAAYTLTRDPPYKVEATLQENTIRDSQDLKKGLA